MRLIGFTEAKEVPISFLLMLDHLPFSLVPSSSVFLTSF